MSPLGSDEIAGLGFEQVVRLEMSPELRTEVRLTAADAGRWRGEVIAYARTARPPGSSCEITGLLGIHRDVGERKGAEEALRETNRRSDTITRRWAGCARSGRGGLRREDVLRESMLTLFPEAVDSEFYERYHEAMREQWPLRFKSYFEPPTPRAMYLSGGGARLAPALERAGSRFVVR